MKKNGNKLILLIFFTVCMARAGMAGNGKKYLITSSSAGNVELGMALRQVKKISGKPQTVKNLDSETCGETLPLNTGRGHVSIAKYPGLDIWFHKNKVVRILVLSKKFFTRDKISVGLSLAKFKGSDMETGHYVLNGKKVIIEGCTGAHVIEGSNISFYTDEKGIIERILITSKSFPCDEC